MMSLLWLLAASTFAIDGIVLDSAQQPIRGAVVSLESVESTRHTATDPQGRFHFASSSDTPLRLTVTARGYAPVTRPLDPNERTITLHLVPLRVAGEITVTATRTPLRVGEIAADIRVVSRESLLTSASPTLDDSLRQVPGFTLFRRSGSRVANPTAQGVSLRGVGASGASRALVLDDGVPLNDPFGGWVYWGRVPRALIDRVDVLRGGGAELYGSSAFGGVVNLIRRQDGRSFSAEWSTGTPGSFDGSVYISEQLGAFSLRGAVEYSSTDGYVLVASDQRGRVDIEADSERNAIDATIARGSLFLRASRYAENRSNGTPLQVNDTELYQISGGGEWTFGDNAVSARVYASEQDYFQTFSTVSADRASERLNRVQRVPSEAFGVSTQYSRALGSQWLVGGFEIRDVEGRSDEEIHAATVTRISNGGRQRLSGFFAEDVIAVTPRFSATLGARYDRTSSYDAFSPRVSLIQKIGSAASIFGSFYEAFRAPTLNELHRAFRVGNVLTLANENLEPERLRGIEGGVQYATSWFSARAILFSMNVRDPIANVTLSVTPSLITRQRRNLGETRSRGVEVDADARADRWRFSAGYFFVDAEVTDFEPNRALEGNALPQVPEQQVTAQLAYDFARGAIAVQARWIGEQFDDDQNLLSLDSFSAVDLFASHRLARALHAFVAVENAFDEEYEVGRTPITTVGPPRMVRVGLRYGR